MDSLNEDFKDRIENREYIELNEELRNTQFEIAEWPDDSIDKNGRLKDLKYKTLGWTQLEKKVFSSKNITIDTDEQEEISLKIGLKNALKFFSYSSSKFPSLKNALSSSRYSISLYVSFT